MKIPSIFDHFPVVVNMGCCHILLSNLRKHYRQLSTMVGCNCGLVFGWALIPMPPGFQKTRMGMEFEGLLSMQWLNFLKHDGYLNQTVGFSAQVS